MSRCSPCFDLVNLIEKLFNFDTTIQNGFKNRLLKYKVYI